jgi:hypothetical protein
LTSPAFFAKLPHLEISACGRVNRLRLLFPSVAADHLQQVARLVDFGMRESGL